MCMRGDMMKYVMYSAFMAFSVSSWYGFQLSPFLGALMFGAGVLVLSGDVSCGWGLACDSISGPLIMLSFWVVGLGVLASQGVYNNNYHHQMFLSTNCALMIVLILTFSSKDYLMFYFFFESSLVPMLFMIIGWGYQPERLQAGIYMLFYTLVASLPLLVALLSMYDESGSLIIGEVSEVSKVSFICQLWYLMSVVAFLVKLPVFMAHLWLPKAHVEAPVAGSMVLAGVLLKLGGYGLLRVLPIFTLSAVSLSWLGVTLGAMGGVVVSLICLRQTDMKSLIAYSSVAHMGMVLAGIMCLVLWGVSGAVVVMIGHGLCSSGLFCLANIVYERTGSRSLLVNKGLLNFMPSMALWWFLLTIGNMAAPPTLNMVGEIQLIMSVVGWSSTSMVVLFMLLFFSVSYSLYMYSLSQHGSGASSYLCCCSGVAREYLLMVLHWLPLNVLLIKSAIFM